MEMLLPGELFCVTDHTAPDHFTEQMRRAHDELAARWPDTEPMPHGAEYEAWLGQVVRLREAQAAIAADGPIVADPKGNPIPHPAITIERLAQTEIRRWGRRFDPPKPKAKR